MSVGAQVARRRTAWLVSRATQPLPRTVVLLLAVVTAALVVVILPRHPIDLSVYRRGGAAVLSGADRVYTQPGGDLPFTYPPFAAILLVALAVPPMWLAVPLLAVASLACLYGVLRRCLPDVPATSPLVVLGTVAAVLLEPVWATLSFGQVNLLLAALVTVDLLPPRVAAGTAAPSRRRWSGVLIGIAAGVKLTPAIFLLVPLARRDWPTLARGVAAALGTVALGFVLLPHSSIDYWTSTIGNVGRVGGIAYSGNQSLTGMVWRLAGPGGNSLVTTTLSALVLVVLVAVLARMGRAADPLTALVLAATAGLLVSPISWNHHWVWVVPILVWLGRRGLTLRGRAVAVGHPGSLALAVLWLVACYSHVIWWAPNGNDREYGASLPAQLATSAYVVLGLVTLAYVAVTSWTRRREDPSGRGRVGR